MSGVKRYIAVGEFTEAANSKAMPFQAAYATVVLASDYDTLAQRCAELEVDLAEQATLLKEVSEQRDFLDRLQSDECARREKTETERDALRVRCAELYEANNERNAAHVATIQERDTLRAEVEQARHTAEYWKAEHLAGNAAIDQLRTAIADPESVFVNMKRGTIAKPGLRSMIDLYGEVPNCDETQLLEIAQLRAEVEQLRKDAERYRGVRRVAAAHGYTEEQFDEQTDRQLSRLNDAITKAKEAEK